MDIRRLFGANLRRARLAAKLSQEAVAILMGVDRAHVSSMERGKQNVTLLTLWAVCDGLKISPASLFDETVATIAERPVSAPSGPPAPASRKRCRRGRNPSVS
ncbi:helix-turn-helix domain-containing protein [Acidiphilium sp. AL]|uniref:Helix-turn-helix domain-containing protein n=1 Tax=Acidiphilium iwatense TaxID=768198 RepID=A0ABS9E0T3_9PROT|nr:MULTISPECIES: helix-turn-helix transcriptional regulator [Acidiphilium]MCF3948005.1 helix-turn-helix domain-containing protein [Acidiphilium iwatense]MCU4161592.1 helix-turn-helix domain-containing protein [Acidiphilium sp. AL]